MRTQNMNISARFPRVLTGLFAVAAAFAVMSAADARPAHAQEWIVQANSISAYPSSASFGAIGSGNSGVQGAELGVGYDLGSYLAHGLRAYVTWQANGQDATRFGNDLSLSWSRNIFMVGADYGPDLWGFVRPSVRVGVGYSLQHLSVDNNQTPLSQNASGLAARASVGLELFIPYMKVTNTTRFTIGLTGRWGYLVQTAANFDNLAPSTQAKASNGTPWPRAADNFGTLDTSGMFWTAGAEVRLLF